MIDAVLRTCAGAGREPRASIGCNDGRARHVQRTPWRWQPGWLIAQHARRRRRGSSHRQLPSRTVSVEGVATVPIAQNANLAAATSVYRQGMAAAVADGQSKAEFLASKAGATLGERAEHRRRRRLDRVHRRRRRIRLRPVSGRTARLRLAGSVHAHADRVAAAAARGAQPTTKRLKKKKKTKVRSRQEGRRDGVHAERSGVARLRHRLRSHRGRRAGARRPAGAHGGSLPA